MQNQWLMQMQHNNVKDVFSNTSFGARYSSGAKAQFYKKVNMVYVAGN